MANAEQRSGMVHVKAPVNVRMLTFKVENQWLALNVSDCHEVVHPQSRTIMPMSLPAVNGLINLRGRILTELDLRKALGFAPREEGAVYRILITESEKEVFGVAVDSVGEVIELQADEYERTPDSLDARWKSVSQGVLKQNKRTLVMLDLHRLIDLTLPRDEGAAA